MKTQALGKLYILILSIGTILSLYIPKNEVIANDQLVIPDEAIRLRILANSDSEEDQMVKRLVRDAVNEEITKWVSELTSVEDARNLIQSKLPEIQEIAEEILEEENVPHEVQSEFGIVDFPTKLYGEFLYPAGKYEAVLLTIGEGKGSNWWCVLFPPLCFLDFSNGVAVSEGFEEEKSSTENLEDGELKEVDTEKEKESESSLNKEGKEKEETQEIEETGEVQKEEQKEAEDKETTENEVEEPIYVEEDEEPVKVKFFLLEIFDKIFG